MNKLVTGWLNGIPNQMMPAYTKYQPIGIKTKWSDQQKSNQSIKIWISNENQPNQKFGHQLEIQIWSETWILSRKSNPIEKSEIKLIFWIEKSSRNLESIQRQRNSIGGITNQPTTSGHSSRNWKIAFGFKE